MAIPAVPRTPAHGQPDVREPEFQELTPAEFLLLNRQSPWRALDVGSRMRSRAYLDLLALEGTDGAHRWEQLRDAVTSGVPREQMLLWDVPRVLCAALLACVLEPDHQNVEAATAVMVAALDRSELWHPEASRALRLAVQVAVIARAEVLFEELAALPTAEESISWAGRTDLLRPLGDADRAGERDVTAGGGDRTERWWALFNKPFTDHDLPPFVLTVDEMEPSSEFFPSIGVPEALPCSVPCDEQSLVSIIVPTYNPDAGFRRTIDSLTHQSWSNIEVLIVDDCSTTGREHLSAAAASDPRVRVIACERNGGAYRARNAALREARGEYVTFQDADDISHTQRVELQLLPLLSDPEKVASTSRSQRVLSTGAVTYLGYLPHRTNESSLLFRRAAVLDRLGQFDAVRKGGDSEFAERLRRCFGKSSVVKLRSPLGLVQLKVGSLSRGDFRPNWMSGARLAYSKQFGAVHSRIQAAGSEDWRLSASRPSICTAPPEIRGEQPAARVSHVVLADWSSTLEGSRDGIRRVRKLLAGVEGPVGLLNGSQPRSSRNLRTVQSRRRLTDAVEQGELRWLSWRDATHVDDLVVDSPEYLLALPAEAEIGISADRVHVMLDETVRRTDRPVLPPIAWCEEQVRTAFGARVSWMVSSPALLRYLEGQGVDVALVQDPPVERSTLPDRPVVGVVLPRHVDGAEWDVEVLRSVFAGSRAAEVLFYDEGRRLRGTRADAAGITVVPSDQLDRAGFLQKVDVLVPDMLGQRLHAAESWLWLAREHDVVPLLPDGLETVQQVPVLRYSEFGAGELVSALAADPDLARRLPGSGSTGERAGRRAPGPASRTSRASGRTTRIRYVVVGEDGTVAHLRSRLSISQIERNPDLRTVRDLSFGTLTAAGVFAGLEPNDRVCVVDAGFELEPGALASLDPGTTEDLHVFTDASASPALNRNVVRGGLAPITENAFLWVGSTPMLVRADVLWAATRRFPAARNRGFVFAATLAISGGFGVLGEVRSYGVTEDGATQSAEVLTRSWYLDFARDWADLLEATAGRGAVHVYLQRLFLHLLSVRLRLNTGGTPKRIFSPVDLAVYEQDLSRALRHTTDELIWSPRRPTRIPSPIVRMHLLRLKHGASFEPSLGHDERGPYASFRTLELERPDEVVVAVDSMVARDGTLTVRGRVPLVFSHPAYRLELHVGERPIPVADQGRYADTSLHGTALHRAFTFTASVPFADATQRLELRYASSDTRTAPLPLRFARPGAKLSDEPGAYWAVPGLGILTAGPRGIDIAPYSEPARAAAEQCLQRTLEETGDPVRISAARLRAEYFRSRSQYDGRRIWMYADRIVKGGDNGEYAYRHAQARAQVDGVEAHYVLQPGTPLAAQFEADGVNYLAFGTDSQKLHYLNASIVFATRIGASNTFGFQLDQKYFRDLFDARVVYINHGLVVDNLDNLLNIGFTNFDRICVVSEHERQNLVQASYGYRPDEVEVTGFARYDGLRSRTERTVLLAPTWRTYLHSPQRGVEQTLSHRAFRQTDYFQVFNSLINSPRLHVALEKHGYRLLFLLHPNTGTQLTDFVSKSDRVEVRAATEDVSYEQLLTASDLMITDYSGVQFDFAQMRKPVLYYQPDSIPPHYQAASFDYETDAFGEVAKRESELLDLVERYLDQECALGPEFAERIEKFFAYFDHENSKRIYEVGLGLEGLETGEVRDD
ncbi:bifunctional glycosyltransferase/CDP-glycerol:glycerophosphate glycerophosphotransferase [Cellulosimicrobium arenosum]|uniref:CDP-glycerol glycerophosphotransferase family protein n=1 Tax=Cellulosimicrobium arenosum TaxID=2708133 RepID=A0A927PG15_9MICO|nr:CDP-glycerol glycerophosphotransferase family protein [Cellulosimicrobium arenosum]MBD8080179.1 CDP-glycerol glycerophosphotransferase family protein [Cellulosimicrobium arenosum]